MLLSGAGLETGTRGPAGLSAGAAPFPAGALPADFTGGLNAVVCLVERDVGAEGACKAERTSRLTHAGPFAAVQPLACRAQGSLVKLSGFRLET